MVRDFTQHPTSQCQEYKFLKELMETKFAGVEQAIQIAKESLDLRLEGMNEFRKQISDQAACFIPRQEYQIQHQNVVDKLESLDGRMRDVERVKADIQGRLLATGAVATVVLAAIQFVIHFVFMGK